MGIDRTDYLIVGWKLNPDLYRELDIAATDSGQFIYDYMSGKYLVFGNVIAHTEEPEGFDFTTIEPEQLIMTDYEIFEMKQNFMSLTDRRLMECAEETVPKAMLFSHFW